MKKFVIAAVLFAQSAPAFAGVPLVIDSDRWDAIKNAAEPICRIISGPNIDVEAALDRVSKSLTKPETMLLTSLCILYMQGKIDAAQGK